MEKAYPIYKGIIDEKLNPFSKPSWRKEGNPEGSGREMTEKRMEQFKKVLIKGGLVADIKQPNYERYPAFQAIRWGYAKLEGKKLITTKKWDENKLV